MIPRDRRNGNGAAVADTVPEAGVNVPEVRTVAGQTIDLATRTRQRARQQFQQNKFVIIGAGALVVDLLLFVALSVPHKHTVQKPRGTVAGQQDPTQPSESSSVEPSLLPITDSGRPPAKATHEGNAACGFFSLECGNLRPHFARPKLAIFFARRPAK